MQLHLLAGTPLLSPQPREDTRPQDPALIGMRCLARGVKQTHGRTSERLRSFLEGGIGSRRGGP